MDRLAPKQYIAPTCMRFFLPSLLHSNTQDPVYRHIHSYTAKCSVLNQLQQSTGLIHIYSV
uniref:Uncharacterized protein n=1 Tax=Anguilla anguilla TaxID=7936 RepID=A0A0E9XW19_ANGAN